MPAPFISLTTSPSRLPHLLDYFSQVLPGWPKAFEEVLLHLPKQFRDKDDYPAITQPLPDRLRIVRHGGNDPGPALKLLGALRSTLDPDQIILCIDDDVAYPIPWLESLLEHALTDASTVFGGSGFNWNGKQIEPVRGDHVCEVLQGFAGIAWRARHFDLPRLEATLRDADDDLRFSDDLLLSHHVAENGIERRCIDRGPMPLAFQPWGDRDPQALKFRGGGNHQRYRRVKPLLA